jgi:hypothetical protein
MEKENDSRDWIPPLDMRDIFEMLAKAKDQTRLGNKRSATENLIEAVEALAVHVAGDRGRHG